VSDNPNLEPIPVPEDAVYGITIFQTESDRPIVTVSGTPDMGQLQRILAAAQMNLQANITAEATIKLLKAKAKQSPIIQP